MTNHNNKVLAATAALALTTGLSATTAHAGGFLLNDFGASATGRANAVTATVDDGSAIFYNPAGIGRTKSTASIYVGATGIAPYSDFTSEVSGVTTDAEDGGTVTPHLYAYGTAYKFIKIGVGLTTPFGSSTAWPASSPGREQSRSASLRTFFISPVVGLDLSEFVPGNLYVGGGVDFVPADVELGRDILFGDVVGEALVGADAFGLGGRFGVQYEPIEQISLGVAYRSKVSLDFEGQGDLDIAAPFRAALPPDGPVSSALVLPQSVLFGIAVRPLPNLEIEFNGQWQDWRDLEELTVNFSDGSASVARYDWNDVLTLRLGAEYKIVEARLTLRAGYAFDPTPYPDTTLGFAPPDADRHNVYLGGNYNFSGGLFLDLGLLYGLPVSSETSEEPLLPQIKGRFGISFVVAALSVGFNFGDGS